MEDCRTDIYVSDGFVYFPVYSPIYSDVSNLGGRYNTGHTITGLVLLYDLLPSNDWFRATARSWAKTMVQASINRDKSLFDLTVSNKKWRYWWDNNFFVHLLVEGLVLWGRRFGSEDALLWNSIQAEVKREMGYAITYLRDPQDCLYVIHSQTIHY